MESWEKECVQKRTDILNYCRRLADDGAHYLWGAEGEKPRTAGAVAYAPISLDASQLNQTTFCAATKTVGGVVYVCAGRFRHSGLSTAKPSRKVAILPNQPTVDDSVKKDLQDFIQKYSGTPGAQVGWGSDLTPRLVKGDSIMDYSTVPFTDITNAVVWGEGCDDTQHFDCGGFVRYVVQKVCGVSIAGISANPEKANPVGEKMGSALADDDIMLPADILVYAGHIAFATEKCAGMKYNKHQSYEVAQAESAAYGVNVKSRGGTSQKCIRLSPTTLLNRKIASS
jgi:cell wall-associated NlpC family hydrolase